MDYFGRFIQRCAGLLAAGPVHQYFQLEYSEIRLLELLPFETGPSEPIRCSLKHHERSNCPEYVALSYTWGDPAKTKPIFIDGCILRVTENLESALRHLRQAKGVKTIWADAVCINQGDEKEKSEQVQQMRKTYRNSACTVVWLGEASDDSDFIMDTIGEVCRPLVRNQVTCDDIMDYSEKGSTHMANGANPVDASHGQWLGFNPSSLQSPVLIVERTVEQLLARNDIDAVHDAWHNIMLRSWWRRVWVIQEYSLPSRVEFACGNRVLSSSLMELGVHLFLTIKTRIIQWTLAALYNRTADQRCWQRLDKIGFQQLDFTAAMNMTLYRQQFHESQSMNFDDFKALVCQANVLEHTTVGIPVADSLQASDPRDRIYALLGLFSSPDELGILPDYSKDCKLVYTDVAKTLLDHAHVDILALCQEPRDPSLPSWVPDWKSSVVKPIFEWFGYKERRFDASNGRAASLYHYTNRPDLKEVLCIRGTTVGRIRRVADVWSPSGNLANDWVKAGQLIDSAICFYEYASTVTHPIYAESDEEWTDKIARLLILDCEMSMNSRGSRAGKATTIGFRAFRDLVTRREFFMKTRGTLDDLDPGIFSELNQFYARIKQLGGRRLFVTEEGYLGWGPARCQQGDVIAILFGGHQPFVLCDSIQSKHKLLGEVYVLGIMDGEFLSQGCKEFDFHII